MIRVGLAAPTRERCGVADDARLLADAMSAESMPEAIEVSWLPYPESGSRAAWRSVARQAAALAPDVLHVHYETGLFHTVRPLRNRFATLTGAVDAPLVVTLHGALPELRPSFGRGRRGLRDLLRDLLYLPFFGRWERRQVARVSCWITHTEEQARRLARLGVGSRCELVPLPAPPVSRRWRAESADPKHLVTPGFVKEEKGLDLMLEVLAALPSLRWTVLGGPQDEKDDGTLSRLRERVSTLGLEASVRVTGFLPRGEVDERLSSAGAVVLPYRSSWGSAAGAWAAAVGTPIVASGIPAFREMAELGAGIELAPPGDVPAWTAAVSRLIEDPEHAAHLSERSLAWAAAHDARATAARTVEVYRKALREPRV